MHNIGSQGCQILDIPHLCSHLWVAAGHLVRQSALVLLLLLAATAVAAVLDL